MSTHSGRRNVRSEEVVKHLEAKTSDWDGDWQVSEFRQVREQPQEGCSLLCGDLWKQHSDKKSTCKDAWVDMRLVYIKEQTLQ